MEMNSEKLQSKKKKAQLVFLCYLVLWISSSSLSYLAALTFSVCLSVCESIWLPEWPL